MDGIYKRVQPGAGVTMREFARVFGVLESEELYDDDEVVDGEKDYLDMTPEERREHQERPEDDDG